MSQPPNLPPPVPLLRSSTHQAPRAPAGRWKGPWIAGLICALLPALALAVILLLALTPGTTDEFTQSAALSIVHASAWVIRWTVIFAGIAVLCAAVTMFTGAPGRGLVILFLTLPVWGVYFIVKQQEKISDNYFQQYENRELRKEH